VHSPARCHVRPAEEAAEAAAAAAPKTEGVSAGAEADSTAEAAAGSASASSPPIAGASAGTDDSAPAAGTAVADAASPPVLPAATSTAPSKHVHSQSTFFNLVGPPENLELKPIAQKIMVRSAAATEGRRALVEYALTQTGASRYSLAMLLDAGGGHAVLSARDLRHRARHGSAGGAGRPVRLRSRRVFSQTERCA